MNVVAVDKGVGLKDVRMMSIVFVGTSLRNNQVSGPFWEGAFPKHSDCRQGLTVRNFAQVKSTHKRAGWRFSGLCL